MGLCGRTNCSIFMAVIAMAFIITAATADTRCKDESFCRAYCLSTNPTTVSARCGRDMASCICVDAENQAVKVRFIEERSPVPSTPPTTPRPTSNFYAQSQYTPSNGQYNYNGNGNSISQNQPQQPQQSQQTPVLLECDASDTSTRMCHLFCTMEIRAWYGLCNITSKACACFGLPLSAVQEEPIAAIFHSTALLHNLPAPTPAPTTTPKPTYSPPLPGYQQLYPPQQYLQQVPQQQQQQWTPLPQGSFQAPYNNNQYYPASSPTVLNAAATQNNQQAPVRSNSQAVPQGTPTSFNVPMEESVPTTTSNSASVDVNVGASPMTVNRRRRSLNDMPIKPSKGKEPMDMKSEGCSKFKCAIACKRNNYFSPDCEPKCIDNACWCECFPRL